jgi:hypothetical protein
LLLARRLAEVGVSFSVVYWGGWDHHRTLFKTFREGYAEKLDRGLSGLISDLDQRGMLDTTLVVCLGEFGRTPKVNKDAGRDHWPGAMSVLFAGGGVPRGAIVGATDPKGYYASDNVYSPEDFAVSLYTKLGVDPHQVLHTAAGRPVQLVNGGRPIKELFVGVLPRRITSALLPPGTAARFAQQGSTRASFFSRCQRFLRRHFPPPIQPSAASSRMRARRAKPSRLNSPASSTGRGGAYGAMIRRLFFRCPIPRTSRPSASLPKRVRACISYAL